MNIGICDDAPAHRAQLSTLLHASKQGLTITEYASGEALLAGLANGDTLQLLLLDIYMGGLNGMETAQKIRKTGNNLPIVFLTTSPDFALPAFGVHAAGYLLKPVNPAELLHYVIEYSHAPTPTLSPTPETWVVDTTKGTLALSLAQLMYCEQNSNYSQLHMADGTLHTLRMTFGELLQQLAPYPQMTPCGRSFLLNLLFVRTVQRQTVTLTNGATLPTPRRAYAELREAYLAFYKGGALL